MMDDRRHTYLESGLWDDTTLAQRVAVHAAVNPDRLAVVEGESGFTMTYSQLWDDARAVAGFLSSTGIGHGDVVSVQLPNWYSAVVADLAVLAIGAVLNPLLPNYRTHELIDMMSRAQSRVLFTPGLYRNFDHLEMANALANTLPSLEFSIVVGSAGSDAQSHNSDPIYSLSDVLATWNASSWSPATSASKASEPSEIIFTSGTESRPKAVMHTEQTTNCAVRLAAKALGLGSEDVVWMPSPIGHSTGLNYGVRLALYFGLPLVLQDRWSSQTAIDLIEHYGCTYTLAATTFLADLTEAAATTTAKLETLRFFGCGGAPVPAELVCRAEKVGIKVLRLYGSTEALVVSWNRPQSPSEKREGTDGLLMPHVEVEIRDNSSKPLDRGATGEIYIRSPTCSIGLLDSEPHSRSILDGSGWVISGDLGVVDPEGYLSILGRKKEIIIRGGMNIAPREIEDVIAELTQVAAVSAIGLPDERLGEIVCVCVVLNSGESLHLDALRAELKSRNIARYKWPERLAIVDHLPMTASGKVQKHSLLALVQAIRPRLEANSPEWLGSF